MNEARPPGARVLGLWALVVLGLVMSRAPLAAHEPAAPVGLSFQVAGTPALGGSVTVTVTAVPQVDCDRLNLSLDLPRELSLAGGAGSWGGPAAAGTPVRIVASVRVGATGVLPVGATAAVLATGTTRVVLRSQAIYLDVPAPGRAVGRVLPQAPVLYGPLDGGVARTRVVRAASSRQTPTANLTGKFFYKQNGDGALVPIAGCQVRVLDGATEVATATTAADGAFAVSVPRGKTYKVEIRSETGDGSLVTVYRSLPNNVHAYQKEVTVPGDAVDVTMADETVPSYPASASVADYSKDMSGAFGILDAVRLGQRYIEARGETLKQCKAVWGANVAQAASYYDSGANVFYIRGQKNRPGQWQPDVVLHEYGHYVHENYSRTASQGGTHNPGQQDPAFAWSEGWATFFMGAVQNDPVYEGLATFNIETDVNGWGKQSEDDVAGILWDIFDAANDAGQNDQLSLGIDSIWAIFRNNKPVTLQEFVNVWLYDPNRAKGLKSLGNEEQLLRICRGHRDAARPGVYNVRIVYPAKNGSVNAGPHDNPTKFVLLVETRWDHDTLLTDARSFSVQVGDDPSKTVTPAFRVRNRQYELDVRQPPKQPSDGLYDLIVFASHNESIMTRSVTLEGGAWVTRDTVADGAVKSASIREDGARYAAAGGIELALIIDSSGSMSWNDPTGMRKRAAKLLIDTAEEGDAIAVVDFDSSARVWAALTPITGKPGSVTPDRTALKAAVDRVDDSGGTNIEAGLQLGYNQLNASTTGLQKAAILLTDGQGTYSGAATAAFAAKGWPVFSIGLSGDVDENLLRGIANQTGGRYYKAPTDQQLIEIFTLLRGAPKGESTLATRRGRVAANSTEITPVVLDGTVSSVTFSTSWASGTLSLELVRPDGSVVSPTDPGVSHGVGTSFEFYNVEQPVPGTWTMRTINN
ncbi:MAG: vWA domain-containing protein, partial [Armatimonadota bacterium]|nr:vWA domain-containing protein [Armatimonadota bacterium]